MLTSNPVEMLKVRYMQDTLKSYSSTDFEIRYTLSGNVMLDEENNELMKERRQSEACDL